MRRLLVETALASLVAAVVVGVAWWMIAPEVLAEVTDDGIRLGAAQAASVFAFDAWFGVLSVVAGLVVGTVVALRHRSRLVAATLALAVAGVAGSLVAWRVGVALGPAPVDSRAEALEAGSMLPLDLRLEAYGVLVLWPAAAVVAVLLVAAALYDRAPARHAARVRRNGRSVPPPRESAG